jgi:hypothetical protein
MREGEREKQAVLLYLSVNNSHYRDCLKEREAYVLSIDV